MNTMTRRLARIIGTILDALVGAYSLWHRRRSRHMTNEEIKASIRKDLGIGEDS